MIHEVNKHILNYMIEHIQPTDRLTFDDGLYSCFYYWPGLRDMFSKNEKIFFISTGLVRKSGTQGEKDFTCEDALRSFTLESDTSGYMSWEEIKVIQKEGGIIGGHGHLHYGNFGKKWIQKIGKELLEMKEHLAKNLGNDYQMNHYACPYNKNHRIEKTFLGKGVEILGRERYDIRELMGEPGYKQNEYRQYNPNNK